MKDIKFDFVIERKVYLLLYLILLSDGPSSQNKNQVVVRFLIIIYNRGIY